MLQGLLMFNKKPQPVMEGIFTVIQGRVQGIGFCKALQKEAEALHVYGWCQENEDGDIVTIMVGESSAVRQLFRWCKQGPPGAWVSELEDNYIFPEDALYQKTLKLCKNKFVILESGQS